MQFSALLADSVFLFMRYKTRLLIIGTFLFIKVYRMNKDNRKIQIVWKKEENMVAEIRESQERESNRMSLSEDVIQKYRDDAGIIKLKLNVSKVVIEERMPGTGAHK